MKTIQFYISILLFIVLKSPYLSYLRLLNKKNPDKAYEGANKASRNIMKKLIKVSGSTIKVTGLEHVKEEEKFILIANHQGIYDIPLILSEVCPKAGFVAKKELKKIPTAYGWMSLKDCVFIDRENPRKALRAIEKHIQESKSPICIFPEGTRSKGEQMSEFKTGAFRMAKKANIKIVPVVISGSYKILEQNEGKVKPAKVEIKVLPSETFDGTYKNEKEWAMHIQEKMNKELNKTVQINKEEILT